MNLSRMLSDRAAAGVPVRVGLIGAGCFGTMVMAQARTTPGIHLAAVADLDRDRAHTALALAQWPPLKAVARSLADALESGGTFVTTDASALTEGPGLDLVVEASGDPAAAVIHADAAIASGVSVIMATVAAEVLAGPLLAARAAERGVIYSLAGGDRPGQVCALVDEARAAGFEVVAAGMGTRYLPAYRSVTPDTVWTVAGITADRARIEGLSARTVTAALDGTEAALAMAAVANAGRLAVAGDGLGFEPCGAHDLPHLFRPRVDGGILDQVGQVAAVSSLERDGRKVVGDLRHGAWVVIRASGLVARSCLADAGLPTDPSGTYGALWRPFCLGGLDLGVTVARMALCRQPVCAPAAFAADVAAIAKRDLAAGDHLDGPGGHTVLGRLLPAAAARATAALPIGLSGGARVTRPVAAGTLLTWDDVVVDAAAEAVDLRRAMENEIPFV